MAPVDTVAHEARLARIEAKMDGFAQRFDEVVVTQQRDHGKRLREVEMELRELRERLAREEGQKAGSKATLAAILALVSSCGGFVGAWIARVF